MWPENVTKILFFKWFKKRVLGEDCTQVPQNGVEKRNGVDTRGWVSFNKGNFVII
jgi:hypothetical protein